MRRFEVLACLLLVLVPASPAAAGWLSKIIGAAEHAGGRAARHGVGSLDNVAAHIKALPHKPDSHALAVSATPEGHWRFTNRAGETITAASPEELRRALTIVAPDAAGAEAKLALYLSEDTAFRHRSLLKDLPPNAPLHVLADNRAYRLLRSPAGGERLFAEVRPNVLVELTEPKLFAEALYQLGRPLDKAKIRVIALQPGHPGALPPRAHVDTATGRSIADTIDPDRLRHGMGNLRGQTAVVTGRVEGDLLYFKPASGPERSLLINDLKAAAEAADANLLILRTSSASQPGGRNWLWQRREVRGLNAALERNDLADLLDGLGGRMHVATASTDASRARLVITREADLAGAPAARSISDTVTDVVSDLAGRIITSSVEVNVRSKERQRELDARIIPDIPSAYQIGYIASFVLGLFGLPVARGWWQRLWPAEQRQSYASATGYLAARAVRGLLMLLVFVPLVAIASAPTQAVLSLWGMVLAAVAILTWPFRRLFGGARA
jgi:hypothetical protein